MNFKSDASVDGKLIYGYEDGWHRERNRGGYNQGRDFFWVHWEVGERKPGVVKMHVECPKAAIDPELNAIKQEVVAALLAANFKSIIEQAGFTYKVGSRAQAGHMRGFKCTAPFHVTLPEQMLQDTATAQANIELVNAAAGEAVRQAVERFRPQLDCHFPK